MAADIFTKIECTYCQEEITNVRIQCNECPDFDLCVQCFSTGAEIGPHKSDHAYKIFDHCAANICGGKGNWTGKEQLQLLEAMEKFGFNNWERVSKYVKTRKPEEVRDEYLSRYLDGVIGVATWNEVRDLRPVLPEHTAPDKGPLAPSVTARLPPLDCTTEEADLIGYIPNRDDYEQEYDPEAETLISNLQLRPNESTELEVAVKLAHVDMYSRKLRERARRKRIVKDYQLVAKFFANQRKEIVKKPLNKQQRTLRENMRVFSQFLTSREHERLMENIDRERELRFRLSELMRYRSLGLTTQEETVHYEQHVAYERQQQLRKTAGSGGFATILQGSPSESDEKESPSSPERKIIQLQEEELPESSKNISSNACDIQPVPLSLLPQGNCLSQHELQLCSSLNILPIQYRILKSLIIQDNLTSKNKSKPLDEPVANGSENSIKDVVTKYLKVSGWLPSVSVV